MARQRRLTFPLSDRDRCERGSLPQDAHSGRDGEKTQRGAGALWSPDLQFQLPCGTRRGGRGGAAPPHSGRCGGAQFFPRYF